MWLSFIVILPREELCIYMLELLPGKTHAERLEKNRRNLNRPTNLYDNELACSDAKVKS